MLFPQATFLRLTKGEEYTLTIKTLVNGFPVGQVVKTFNTNSLGKLERVETIDIDGIMDEEEAPAPQEEEEEILKKKWSVEKISSALYDTFAISLSLACIP